MQQTQTRNAMKSSRNRITVRCLLYSKADEKASGKDVAQVERIDSESQSEGQQHATLYWKSAIFTCSFPFKRGIFRRTVGFVNAVNDVSFNILARGNIEPGWRIWLR